MSSQIRYPQNVYQEKDGTNHYQKWENLDNIKKDDWENLVSVELDGNKGEFYKPAPICLKDFNFQIPEKSKIQQINVVHEFHTDLSANPVKIEAPTIEILATEKLKLHSHVSANHTHIERVVSFNLEDITYEEVNSEDFGFKIEFPENGSNNDGFLFIDFLRVEIIYDTPQYIISSGQTSQYYPVKTNPIKKHVGDTVKFTVYFRNANNISKDKQAVELNIPDGLEFETVYYKGNKENELENKYGTDYSIVNELDKEKWIWYPAVRGKGSSAIRLVFKCITKGTKIFNAFNNSAGNTPNYYVEVIDEDIEIEPHNFEVKEAKWGDELQDDEEFQEINKDIAIEVENVTMEFELAAEKVDNLKEYIIRGVKRDLPPKNHFRALDDISFTINKGERVGVVGFNGAGKSTLLKILSGVMVPTEGEFKKYGTVAPLLELGAGFDHNYNGRENIFLNGAILGYSKEFLKNKYEEIVEFSELGEFIEVPIKNYSSGMSAKLGFSIATIVEPDILILDEVLSVGDVRFQKKSGDKLKEMMGSGTTVLLVSHSTSKIRSLCTRAIWLDKGKLIMDGDVDYVCDAYIEAAKKASADEVKDLVLE